MEEEQLEREAEAELLKRSESKTEKPVSWMEDVISQEPMMPSPSPIGKRTKKEIRQQ